MVTVTKVEMAMVTKETMVIKAEMATREITKNKRSRSVIILQETMVTLRHLRSHYPLGQHIRHMGMY